MKKGPHQTVVRSWRVPQTRNHFQVMTTEQEVKDHTRKMESGEWSCYCQACPHCSVELGESLTVHECRRRSFRVLVGRCVRVYRSWVLRLKCPGCKRTFTDYPPFRLALQTVRQRNGTGQNKRLFGDRQVLPEGRPSPAPVSGVRRPAGPSPRETRRRAGPQQCVALALGAGSADSNVPEGLPIDQPEGPA